MFYNDFYFDIIFLVSFSFQKRSDLLYFCNHLILVIKNAHKLSFCNYEFCDLSGTFNILDNPLISYKFNQMI